MRIKVRDKNKKADALEQSANAYLFLEDMRNSLFPLNFDRWDSPYQVFIHGNDRDKEEEILSIISELGDGNNYNAKSLVKKAFEDITDSLLLKGKNSYLLNRSGNETPKLIPNHYQASVITFGPLFVYKKSFGEGYKHLGFEYKLLQRNLVWQVNLPKKISSPATQYRMIKFLKKLQRTPPLKLVESTYNSKNSIGFEFSEFTKISRVAVLKATKSWGWNERFPNEDTTEYHRLILRLRKERAISILRDHIESEFNALLFKLNYDARLRIHGLKSARFFENLLLGIETEEISFNEVYAALKSYT